MQERGGLIISHIGCPCALIYVPHHFKGQLCIYEDELSAQTLDFTE